MDYDALKRDALVNLCEQRGIRGRSHKTRAQLITLLRAFDQEAEDLARLRERRKAARARGKLPPVSVNKTGKKGVTDLLPANMLTWSPAVVAEQLEDLQAARCAAEQAESLQAARCAAEQAQMIAADADAPVADPVADAPRIPKRPLTIASTIRRHYWQFPMLYTLLTAVSRKPALVQHQEGQLFNLTAPTRQYTQHATPSLYTRID
jgi:hypothetical protein